MCGNTGKAVLRALTGALLCGLASDAAYLQRYPAPSGYDAYEEQAVYRPRPLREHEKPQGLRHVPGVPGVDYPIYRERYPAPSGYDAYEEQAVYRPRPLREHEKPQDLRNVPGVPGVDYPIYHEVPHTSFSCARVPVHPGMYANVETGCQAYHVCHDGREGEQGASFLCTNGTLFDQTSFACDWWYNVDCSQAIQHYRLNADPAKNPYVPKPKPEDVKQQHGIYYKNL